MLWEGSSVSSLWVRLPSGEAREFVFDISFHPVGLTFLNYLAGHPPYRQVKIFDFGCGPYVNLYCLELVCYLTISGVDVSSDQIHHAL